MKTLLLSMGDVEKTLFMRDVIEAVEDGYRAFQKGNVQQPDIVSLEMPLHHGETDIKCCYNPSVERISVKIASGFYDNGKKNHLPTMIGTILLYDGTSGALLCIMDGSLITGIRTAAAGAVSCRLLARKDAKVAAVLGGGGQARMQAIALCSLMSMDRIQVFSPYPEELKHYQKEVEAETGVPVFLCRTVEEAMENADIAISATPARKYLVEARLVKPGMHIVAVGADMAGKNEWDPEIFRHAKVVNDSKAQCLDRGETRNAVQAGVIGESDIYGEIGQLLTGEKPGRESPEEITIFDTTGMGVQDNVTALRVYEAAKAKGLGKEFVFL